MRLRVRRTLEDFARGLQRAYARVIRSAAPGARRRSGKPAGGSLADAVLRPDLVRHERWGFVYTPSRIGVKFVVWWRGSRRQPARGRQVPVDTDRLARELEEDFARQVEGEDRRTSR